MQTDLEKGTRRRRAYRTKVSRESEHREILLDRAVVSIRAIIKTPIVGKLLSHSRIRATSMGQACHILRSVVPVTVLGLLVDFGERELFLAEYLMVRNSFSTSLLCLGDIPL
jgi:hypothetical protein